MFSDREPCHCKNAGAKKGVIVGRVAHLHEADAVPCSLCEQPTKLLYHDPPNSAGPEPDYYVPFCGVRCWVAFWM